MPAGCLDMTTFERVGIALSTLDPGDPDAVASAAVEVERLGYPTLWLPGGQGNNLAMVDRAARATRSIQVATGIISVDQVPAADVSATYAALEAAHPGRFVVGLGGAHGARPIQTLSAYLDALDTGEPPVPADRRILAALGPRLLGLARDRSAGAYPYLVTPDYVRDARTRLGPDARLVVLLSVLAEPDADTARATLREPLRFLATVPGYARNLARMGFGPDEIAGVGDRLLDSVTAWGSPAAIAERVGEYRAAGADQVVIGPRGDSALDPATWARFAELLLD